MNSIKIEKLHNKVMKLYTELEQTHQTEQSCPYCWKGMKQLDEHKFYCQECECEQTV